MESLLRSKLNWKAKKLRNSLLELRNTARSSYSFNDNILISGSGRSGTTWIAEVLSSSISHTLVNEPLKNSNSYNVQKIGFTGWGQFIPEEADWPEAFQFFTRLFTGRELNPNYFTDGQPSINTSIWVHKFIRTPFMLPWIVKNFQTKKPIHIIRNPYAVVASQLHHVGFGKDRIFDPTLHKKVPQFDYFDSFYQEWQPYFAQLESYPEKLALHWALENRYVLNHPRCHNDWIIIYYEDFLLEPAKVLSQLGEMWKIDFSSVDQSALKRDSYSMINKVPDNPHGQLRKWEDNLSQKQLSQVSKALISTGMDIYDRSTGLLKNKI
jgi:hypothetical protein